MNANTEDRYVRACYGNAVDYPQNPHVFTRGTERREYTCTTAELARLIDEETREGWTYAGRADGLSNATNGGKMALVNRSETGGSPL